MASRFTECQICNEDFDVDNHKPIFLPCGHSFCRSCLSAVESAGNKKCPTCRQPIVVAVSQMPVNYALIPSEEKAGADTQHSAMSDQCQIHGLDRDMFCVNCKILICMKCAIKSHAHHHIVTKEDLVNEGGCPTEFVFDVQRKRETRIQSLTKSITVAGKARNCIMQLALSCGDIQEWEDTLLSLKGTATQDLEEWKSIQLKSSKEKSDVFKTLPRQFREDDQEMSNDFLIDLLNNKISELQQISKNVEALLTELTPTSSVDSSFGDAEVSELLEDNSRWNVSNNDDVRKALASVRDDRRPSSLQVDSYYKEPIRMLPEVLNILSAACLGDIKIRDWSSFWGFKTQNWHDFIEKHGHKVAMFYGSLSDAKAVVSTRGESRVELGVGITNVDDLDELLDSIPKWNAIQLSVSFNGNFSSQNEIGKKLQGLNPVPLHFPDIQNGDQGWVNSLLKEYFGTQQLLKCAIYFPRCHLDEDGLRALLKNFEGPMPIYCLHSSLSANARARLDALAIENRLFLCWELIPHRS